MHARAVLEGWDVPVERRPEVVAVLLAVVATGESDRDRIAAAKALLKIPRLQIDAIKADRDAPPEGNARPAPHRIPDFDDRFEDQDGHPLDAGADGPHTAEGVDARLGGGDR